MHTRIAHITDLDEAFPLKNGVPTRKRLENVLRGY